MTGSLIEELIHWSGAVLAYVTLVVVFIGIWKGTHRKAGRESGTTSFWLRSGWFFFFTTALFIGLSVWGWKPINISVSPTVHNWLLAVGSLLFFPGMGLCLWARLTLGRNYFVSTYQGVQLFSDHQLVTNGPFAFIRHPMYIGMICAAAGSLLIYETWTSLCYAVFSPFVLLRSRREELALAEEFGEEWRMYCQRVPQFFPRLGSKR